MATSVPELLAKQAQRSPFRTAFAPELSLSEDVPMILGAIREDGFSRISLRGEDWERPEIRRQVAQAELAVIHVEDLLDPAVARGVLAQPVRLRREFQRRLVDALALLREGGVPSFSLDFDLAGIGHDPARRSALCGVLQEIGPELLRREMRLLLPVRIPAATDVDVAGIPALLREAMSPQILLAAEIHPHECAREAAPLAWLRPIRFQAVLARIEYDAEAGNRLTEALLGPWLRAIAEIGLQDVCFRPRAEGLERAFLELAAIRQLLARLS
jgi:hypothetical protein